MSNIKKKKKKHSLPNELFSNIGNTVSMVQNNIGTLNYRIVPIEFVEFDPENPRQLSITRNDIKTWIAHPNHLTLDEKQKKELDALVHMSETIKKYGVRNPIEIYKIGSKYRLIHGERRCLSSMIANKQDIPARILDEKPNAVDIKLLQFIENVHREGLTLYETLNNIEKVIEAYQKDVNPDIKVTSAFLSKLLNKSETHCRRLLIVLNAPKILKNSIQEGRVNSLRKAEEIAKAKTTDQMQHMIKDCLNGTTLTKLEEISKAQALTEKTLIDKKKGTIGRGKRYSIDSSIIRLGKTSNKDIIKRIIFLVSHCKE